MRASTLSAIFSGMLPAGTGTLIREQLGYQHYRQEKPDPATAPTGGETSEDTFNLAVSASQSGGKNLAPDVEAIS